ncbi:MAG: hypothetical protein ACFCUU_05100 [Cyclobacteriaceae bacterium]
MNILIDFIKIVLPAVIVLYAMYLTITSFIKKDLLAKAQEIKSEQIKIVLPMRLQAFERMSLFLERIRPGNLMLRLSNSSTNVKEYQQLIINEIREEFNHNLSQQIYLSDELWEHIRNAVEDVVSLVNIAAEQLKPEDKGIELARWVFEILSEKQDDLISRTLTILKAEIREFY